MNQSYYLKVKKYFNGDADKTWKWFNTPNSILGASPLDILRAGHENKLKAFIDARLKEYKL